MARSEAGGAISYQSIVGLSLAPGLGHGQIPLVALSVGRRLQPGAIEAAVTAGNGGALGRRRGGGKKGEGPRASCKHIVRCGEDAALELHLCKFRNVIG